MTSEGSRSGVNWMREFVPSRVFASAFYKETFSIGGDGKQTLQNWLGVRFDAGIWVVIEGPTNISKTNTISGAQWNALSPGQCTG